MALQAALAARRSQKSSKRPLSTRTDLLRQLRIGIEVRFGTAKEAVGKLVALAQALGNATTSASRHSSGRGEKSG